MRNLTLSGIFGVLLVALIGCGGSKPVASEGCSTLDELKVVLVEACNEGDTNAIVKRTYPVGNVLADDDSVYKGVESLLNWKDEKDLQLRCVRVLDYNDFTLQLRLGEYEGRTIGPNLTPSHWIAVYYWKPHGERTTDADGSYRSHFTFPVGQADGKWWCAGVAYTDSKASDPSNEALEPLPALGEELSDVPGLSLVRVEPATGAWRSSFVVSEDMAQITRSPKGGHHLGSLLIDVAPLDHWTSGFQFLPDGIYALEIDDLPKSREECFDLVTEAIESSFQLEIEVGYGDREAYRITVPDPLPQDVWSDPQAGWSNNGGGDSQGRVGSYALRGFDFVEFEEWLAEHLEAPVTIANPPKGLHSFDILIGGVEVPKLLEVWLKEGGFGIERYQTTVPTITISRRDHSSDQSE